MLCSLRVHKQAPASLAHDLRLQMLLLPLLLAIRDACKVGGARRAEVRR